MVGHSGNAADGVFHVIKQAIHAGCRLIEVVHRGTNVFECHNQRFDRAAALIGKFDAFTDGVDIAQQRQNITDDLLNIKCWRGSGHDSTVAVGLQSDFGAGQRFEWFTRANKVAVAMGGVDARNRREVAAPVQ